jgi:trk system potassium uptake protein TrkH
MNTRTVLWVVGLVWTAVAVAQLPSLAWALWAGEPWIGFAVSCGVGLSVGGTIVFAMRHMEHALDHRSAFLAVTSAWVSACVLGAVPFHLGLGTSAIDAFFESSSGFTTTGATVLAGLDDLPRSILFWRAMTHWLGGMGMVLLGVAIFPVLGLGGMQLFKAEAPGPTKDKLTPRIAETAKILWVLYLGLTVASFTALWLGGMTPFDAICHAFSTVATGGFSTHDASAGHYASSSFILLSMTFFMIAGGTSFAILHRALTQTVSWRDSPQLRAYYGIFAAAALVMAWNLRAEMPEQFTSWPDALQHALFQSAAILTTTGLTSSDFDTWPFLSHAVLFTLFFVGGMAGSTAGGVKVVRVLIVVRLAMAQFVQLVHPRSYGVIKLGERTVDDQIILGVMSFLALWVMAIGVGALILASLGSDLDTSLTAAAVALGNIGPGFGAVGPSQTYAPFAPTAKLTLIALMILGRLEIYTVLVILTPAFWRR